MFVRGHPPSISIGQQDANTLRTIISNVPDLSVAAFLESELRRAELSLGAYSLLEHVTLESWVLFRLGSGKIQFAKVTLQPTPFAAHVRVTTPIGAALIGLRQDQSIEWQMQDGTIERLTVLMILPATSSRKLWPTWASLGGA
jgi:regulator of nucleoside diphosphate kinase